MVDETDDFITREDAMWAACKALCHPGVRCPDNICAEVRDVFDAIPAADVRPVVLCRDCIHYEMGVCLKIYDDGTAAKEAWQERKPNDFCSYGADMREVDDED